MKGKTKCLIALIPIKILISVKVFLVTGNIIMALSTTIFTICLIYGIVKILESSKT